MRCKAFTLSEVVMGVGIVMLFGGIVTGLYVIAHFIGKVW